MWKRLSAGFLFLFAIANANDAGINEGAYGPQPIDLTTEGESPIRMVAEKLHVRYGIKQAEVTIDFTFQNTSERLIHQKIGFPDVALAVKHDSSIEGKFPNPGMPLENLRTFVDGREIQSGVEYGKIRRSDTGIWLPPKEGDQSLTMAWHVAVTDFPPGKPVTVRRSYTARHGYFPCWYAVFEYYTHTGAQWHGTIGDLDLTVELLDGLTVNDLEWKAGAGNGYKITVLPSKSEWRIISPRKMELHWKDFEPAKQKNRQGFSLVACDQQMTQAHRKAFEEELRDDKHPESTKEQSRKR